MGPILTEQSSNDQVIAMMNSEDILITIDLDANNMAINSSAGVVQPNIIALNGIAHGINAVLLPPNFNVDGFLATCLG